MRNWLFFILLLGLTACSGIQIPREIQMILNRVTPQLKQQNLVIGDPVFIRIFKEENILELWMKGEDSARYRLVKTYSICNWSGTLGPKFFEGDRQAPEGFYSTNLDRLKPDSKYHLAFNIQYPNQYDLAMGKTGSAIMVHGSCVSEGCYAMSDDQIEEIYFLVERALMAGQGEVPIHIFPFKMVPDRIIPEFASPNFKFWMNLREGYDYFERVGVPPKWTVENERYVFY